jgi:membrane protein DedA with SNARE-associated domain
MARMPFWHFQSASAAGAVIWATLVSLFGFYLGTNWGLVTQLLEYLGVGGVAVLILVIVGFWLLRRRALRSWR